MKTTFTTNDNTVYEANETMSYCWKFTKGLKGGRVRISKTEFLAAKEAHDKEMATATLTFKEAVEKTISDMDEMQGLEDELLKAAEDPTVSVEEFVDMITTPKAKKTRKSKDVAFKTIITLADDKIADVTLTAKQTDFLRKLAETESWEGVDFPVWTDILCDEIGGQFTGKPMTVGAMISTLCEKDLGLRTTCRRESRKCVSFELTDLGKAVAKELGLS